VKLEILVALNQTHLVGCVLFRRLHERFGENILKASRRDLEQVPGIGPVTSQAIVACRDEGAREIERAEKAGIRIVPFDHPEFPAPLATLHDPPLVLSMRGTWNDALAIGIVGSRESTTYGIRQAGRFAQEFAGMGITVVSGLARGIDTAAHKAALKKGRTIAVLGSGLLKIYPPENKKLADEIAEKGVLMSEFGVTVGPEPTNFPRRNRIVSGLSLGVLIIEAGEKSGALITADWAMEQSREVFALPGSVESPMSRGCHGLIKQGAKLVEAPIDVLEEIPAFGPILEAIGRPVAMTPIERAVFGQLGKKVASSESIAMGVRLPEASVAATLAKLVEKGMAEPLDGGFVRSEPQKG
jgi:DNA processing protein